METKEPEALKGSIKKWERIVASTRAKDHGNDNCPLCKLFYEGAECTGCPVSQKTKMSGCNGTPYSEWHSHHMREHGVTIEGLSRAPHCKECLRLAKAERDFLISLEPEEAIEAKSTEG